MVRLDRAKLREASACSGHCGYPNAVSVNNGQDQAQTPSIAEGTATAGRHLAGEAAAAPCGMHEACGRALRWQGRLGCLRAHVRYVGRNSEVNTDTARPENNPLF